MLYYPWLKPPEEWQEANTFFETQSLMPAVLAESSPDEKSEVLTNGIYNYLSSKFGIRQSQVHGRRKIHTPHRRALKEVTKKRNAA